MISLWVTNSLGFGVSLGITIGAWRLGSHKRYGWALLAICEVTWIFYAVLLKQWALIPWSGVHTSIYVRNWVKWRVRQA